MHVLVSVALRELAMFSFQELCGARVGYRRLVLLITEEALIISLNPSNDSFE